MRYLNAGNIGGSYAMIYCIPLDTATEEFYASVARAAGLPMEQVLRDALFKLAGTRRRGAALNKVRKGPK